MSATIETLRQKRLIAIVRLEDLSESVELAKALVQGGVFLLEFTLTNPAAIQAIAATRKAFGQNPSVSIGVGSVRKVDQAKAAIDAGAQFVVSPILNKDVIEACVQVQVPIVCGAFSPTEIARAWDAGASMVKVFPARGLGPSYIRDILAPMPEIELIPTGGIDLGNMQSYFDAGAVAVGVGGKLIDQRTIEAGNWAQVESVARQYAQAAAQSTGDNGN